MKEKKAKEKAEQVKALSPLAKAKLRKKAIEKPCAEISTTVMGLQSCIEQGGLIARLAALATELETIYKELLQLVKQGVDKNAPYIPVLKKLKEVEGKIRNPLAEGKGIAITPTKRQAVQEVDEMNEEDDEEQTEEDEE